jgi:hypothetical protein
MKYMQDIAAKIKTLTPKSAFLNKEKPSITPIMTVTSAFINTITKMDKKWPSQKTIGINPIICMLSFSECSFSFTMVLTELKKMTNIGINIKTGPIWLNTPSGLRQRPVTLSPISGKSFKLMSSNMLDVSAFETVATTKLI